MSDCASEALAEASLLGEPRTYDATSKRSGVPLTTLYHCDHRAVLERTEGSRPIVSHFIKGESPRKVLKLMADLGNPVRIKCLPSLAFSIAC